MEKEDIIKKLKEAEIKISSCTMNDLSNPVWLKQTRCSLGYLRDAIKSLNKLKGGNK